MAATGFVSPNTLGRLVGRHQETIRRWIVAGRLPAIVLPSGQYSIPASVVDELLAPTLGAEREPEPLGAA